MPEDQSNGPAQDKGQQLLDEVHGINVGLDRLATAVEELTEVVAASTGIELSEETDVEEYGGSPAGEAIGTLGRALFDFVRNAPRPKGEN